MPKTELRAILEVYTLKTIIFLEVTTLHHLLFLTQE